MRGRYLFGFVTIIQWLVAGIIVLLALEVGEPKIFMVLALPGACEIIKVAALFDPFSVIKLD